MVNSNETNAMVIEADEANSEGGDHDEQSEAGILEVSNEQDQAGSTNYYEAIENSLANPKGTLTGTRQGQSTTGRSGKSNAPKRSRVDPALAIIAAEVDDESENELENYPESEAISFRVIVRRLNCGVPGCQKVFPSKVQLNYHLLTKHAIEKYACKVKDCTESYATRGELTTHRNSAHNNLDNDWPCGQCEVTCNTYKNLWTHTYYYHETGLFACSADKCDFTEKTRIKVHNHQPKHRPAKYRCTYAGCSSSFIRKSTLTAHFRVHSKEKPFLCSQCSKAFAQKGDLTTHERVHSGLKPYSCTWPHCSFSASQQAGVISHIRVVHFNLPLTKKEQKEKGIIDNRDARVFLKKTATNGN